MSLFRAFFLLFLVPFSSVALAEGAQDSPILGRWQFYKKIWDGVDMPEPPTATLRLFFEFKENGESRLYWYHQGESDWCERKGEYSIQEGHLVDKVVWVNPKNSRFCSNDPDMQEGRTTRTPISFNGGDFWLHLHLGGDPLIFVWKNVPPESPTDSGSGFPSSSAEHPQAQ